MMFVFSDDYFQDEVRQGFLVPGYMKRVWASTIKVLENVDKACEALGITYFADSGTLLGAVREKGMIPTDGVMVPMRRPDAWVVGVIRASYHRCNPKLAHLTVFS